MRVEGFCISQVVDQFGKITRHVVGAHGRLVFQPLPTVFIFLNKKSFSQIRRLKLVKYYKIDWLKMKNYVFHLSYRQFRSDVSDTCNDELQY